MLIEKKTYNEDDGSVGYIESIYDSSNILKTIYFPKKSRLFISYKRGGTFSYGNINENLYENFENSKSQGAFIEQVIKKFPNKYPFSKEFKLFESEIKDIKKIIEDNKETLNNGD